MTDLSEAADLLFAAFDLQIDWVRYDAGKPEAAAEPARTAARELADAMAAMLHGPGTRPRTPVIVAMDRLYDAVKALRGG